MELEIIYKFVDESLKSLFELGMMYKYDSKMPSEMKDDSKDKSEDGWIPWKPIRSTVTDEDLNDLEQMIGSKFPSAFKQFLKYKHFYNLDTPNPQEVVFYPPPIHKWKDKYVKMYNYRHIKDGLLSNGFIPFADHQDWGIICFDTRFKNQDNDFPIVMINHETIGEPGMIIQYFANNFLEMVSTRLLRK